MKKIIFLLLILFISFTKVNAFEIQDDKLAHGSMGFLIGVISTKFMDTQYIMAIEPKDGNRIVTSREKDFWYHFIPIATVLTYAILKEATDKQFDFSDLAYSFTGGTIGILITW